MSPGDTAYVSRYALHTGAIQPVVVTRVEGSFAWHAGDWNGLRVAFDIHDSRGAAIRTAVGRRDAEVAALQARINKLNAMEFK